MLYLEDNVLNAIDFIIIGVQMQCAHFVTNEFTLNLQPKIIIKNRIIRRKFIKIL